MKVLNQNCLTYLKSQKPNSLKAIISDPPYGISFMGKDWDKVLPDIEIWKECYRVLSNDGVISLMCSTRTVHRLIEQMKSVGFELAAFKHWAYGSGFPKATDLSKQFDKQAGAKGEVIGQKKHSRKGVKIAEKRTVKGAGAFGEERIEDILAPSTANAKKWEGYKYGLQALKPALEPIIYFVKDKKASKKRIKLIDSHPDIFYVSKPSRKEKLMGLEENNHPTIKPYKLMEYIIDSCSFKGDLVYDPFTGSGTTGIACEKSGRKFVGTELSKEFSKIARLRIKASKKGN